MLQVNAALLTVAGVDRPALLLPCKSKLMQVGLVGQWFRLQGLRVYWCPGI